MKKSIIIFVFAAFLTIGITFYSWNFVDSQIGEVTLTEETVIGNKSVANGLKVGFRAESNDKLHWINSFDFNSNTTESIFKRGDMVRITDRNVYDDIRFTGWATVPYYTELKYSPLNGLQEKELHSFYSKVQSKVMENGSKQTGRIKLRDYLDVYPVSFDFQFGSRNYSSDNVLTALKVSEQNNMLSPDSANAYAVDLSLYTTFNKLFKIPIIDNEYQEYTVSKIDEYDNKTELGYKTEISKPLGNNEDVYEFDPIIVLQEENVLDGKQWYHPDLKGGLSYSGDSSESYSGRNADEYNLKNRMLFVVNNTTVKGDFVDVSNFEKGYGIYEMPFVVRATVPVSNNPKSKVQRYPEPVVDEINMVYKLDSAAEYIEMSLSGDHRYLAIFSIKAGKYYVEMVDADNWTSQGIMELFPETEKMTYTWGEDNSIAIASHDGYLTVLSISSNEKKPYNFIYKGNVGKEFIETFFDSQMLNKENSVCRYKYGIDAGLAITCKGGNVALVQSTKVNNSTSYVWNASLECAILDQSGILYQGRLSSDIVDYAHLMDEETVDNMTTAKTSRHIIEPVRNEIWVDWQ